MPPVLVREQTMEEAGFFPTDRAQVYELPEDELFLVGTSEVPLSALHRGDLFDPDALPRLHLEADVIDRQHAAKANAQLPYRHH